MTRKEIKNKVIEIIADKVYFSVKEIQEGTRFKEDLGTDSLDDIELLMEFEHKFGIKIPDEDMSTVRTVGEVIDGICQKLGVSICKQQQPEVKLEDEIHTRAIKLHTAPCYEELRDFAIHFYELGLNARKEKGE